MNLLLCLVILNNPNPVQNTRGYGTPSPYAEIAIGAKPLAPASVWTYVPPAIPIMLIVQWNASVTFGKFKSTCFV